MQQVNAQKVDAIAGFATSIYASAESATMASARGMSREELALSVAGGAEKRGILSPSLRARLDRMTTDYAAILKRLDDLRMLVEGPMQPQLVPVRVN